MGIRVRLECYVPAVVVCKLDADHLGAVVVLKQRLHLLRVDKKKKSKARTVLDTDQDRFLPLTLTCGGQAVPTSTGVVSGTSLRMMMHRL